MGRAGPTSTSSSVVSKKRRFTRSGSPASSPSESASSGYRRSGSTTCAMGCATIALSARMRPKVVQERLGHTNLGSTLDTYSHVTGGPCSNAADRSPGSCSAPVSNPLADVPEPRRRMASDLHLLGVRGGKLTLRTCLRLAG
jgi:hypothetical protein